MDNKEEKEITFILYNYSNIDKLINSRKEKVFDEINVSNEAWKRSKSAVIGYTIEDVILRIDDDYLIKRLNIWKVVISKFLNTISKDKLLYAFINNKYSIKKNKKKILTELQIDDDEFIRLDNEIKELIFSISIKENMF